MQVFVTDKCPVTSAKNLDDKRVVKMVLETAQLLSNAMHIMGEEGPYKRTHMNHPCTKWAAESINNFYWLFSHFMALSTEYTKRYGKVHKCNDLSSVFLAHILNKDTELEVIHAMPTEFVNCTTNHKHIEDVHTAYQLELAMKWENDKRTPTWYGV